ncbi:hypothetical protein [Epilithonimonas xixisoli]|uniref:Uncharacterized protein n=1 Tax=Epilithonimonas xixisoli TaxID=1476462 RepID=A0A4R8IAL0_9FLAO|nr:hypothetical protein [Epilithonimonas xixisoli]TDX86694.1 hypothetical protein B0I22_0840 [Epilithonimonas xixisoli]
MNYSLKNNKSKFIALSFLILLAVQLFSLTFPPLGFMLGTTILLPSFIKYSGEKNLIEYNKILLAILIFYLLSRTLDWYIAPGTHDNEGIAWMIMTSGIATFIMLFIGIRFIIERKLIIKDLKNLLILLLVLIVPLTHIFILNEFFNQNLNVTNKTLFEYLKIN